MIPGKQATADRMTLLRSRIARQGLQSQVTAVESVGNRPARLSPVQRMLWLHQQRSPSSCAYNVTFICTFDALVDGDALWAAVVGFCDRHVLTRTVYVADEAAESVQQHVDPDVRPEVALVDVPGDDVDFREEVTVRAQVLAARPFDLERESSLRSQVIRGGTGAVALIVSVHHIMWDGPSLDILFDELSRSMSGPMPVAAGVQYRDVADSVARSEESRYNASDLDYWRRQVDPSVEVAALPTSPCVAGDDAETIITRLGAEDCRNFDALALGSGTTGFTIFTACLSAAIATYTGAQRIALGTTIADRTRPGLEHLIGNFGNTVPLRIDLGLGGAVSDLVDHVGETLRQAMIHQNVPLDRIAREVERPVDLIPGLVLYQTYRGGIDVHGARGDWRIVPQVHSAYPFVIQAVRAGDSLEIYTTFQRETLRADVMTGLTAELVRIMGSATLEMPVGELCRVTPQQHSNLVTPISEMPETPGLSAVVESVIRRDPKAIAVVDAVTSLTYTDLRDRAGALAAVLHRASVSTDDVVAIAVPRSAATVVALLGVLQAGAAYIFVPLDYPRARVDEMLDATRPSIAVMSADTQCDDRWEGRCPVVLVDSAGSLVDTEPPETEHSGGGSPPHELAVATILYTSGSSGSAKAVDVTYEALRNRVQWGVARWPVPIGVTRLAKSQMAFIDGSTEILEAISCGAAVAIADEGTCRNAERLMAFARRHGAKHMMAVPSLIKGILELDPGQLSHFAGVVSTGERLSPELARALQDQLPHLSVENSYGCTEVAGDVTVGHVTNAESITVGSSAPGVSVVVLNTRLDPVPAGASGDVYVRGRQVTRGYRDDPRRTVTSYVADPFSSGQRMYRTGDIGIRRPNGEIELLGRRDSQVKVRGHRIDTAEVADALEQVAGPGSAVAVSSRRLGERLDLIAYVSSPSAVTAVDLRRRLSKLLPDYMVPTVLVPVDSIPLLHNGKVDHAALASAPVSPARRESDAPPASRVARVLAGVIAEIVGRKEVDVDANVFELGVDSMRAVTIVKRARSAGLSLYVDDVFTEPTARGLAEVARPIAGAVSKKNERSERPMSEPAAPARGSAVPMSHWGRHLRASGVPPNSFLSWYSTPVGGEWTPDALSEAVRDIARHPDRPHLRTAHRLTGRLWRSHVLDPDDVPRVPVVTFTADESAEAIVSAVAEVCDPATGAIMVAALVDDGVHCALILFGHALTIGEGELAAVARELGATNGDGVQPNSGTTVGGARVRLWRTLEASISDDKAVRALRAALEEWAGADDIDIDIDEVARASPARAIFRSNTGRCHAAPAAIGSAASGPEILYPVCATHRIDAGRTTVGLLLAKDETDPSGLMDLWCARMQSADKNGESHAQ